MTTRRARRSRTVLKARPPHLTRPFLLLDAGVRRRKCLVSGNDNNEFCGGGGRSVTVIRYYSKLHLYDGGVIPVANSRVEPFIKYTDNTTAGYAENVNRL